MIDEKLGRYAIVKTVGSGTMGTVYKAEDGAGGVVAVKLIRSQVLYDIERRERFLCDVIAASQIRHRSVCPVLEIGDDDDDFFVITPFLEGITLQKHMNGRALPWPEAWKIAVEVAEALSAIHRSGTVHRGIKPANIWLVPENTVLLTDCGLARLTESSRGNRARMPGLRAAFADTFIPAGALAYMSPEQLRGGRIDARTDIFSFGVLLYEMLAGSHPFEGRNLMSRMSAILEGAPEAPSSKQPSVPSEFDSITLKALAKSPSDRYRNMEEVIADLKRVSGLDSIPEIVLQELIASRPRMMLKRVALASLFAVPPIAALLYYLLR